MEIILFDFKMLFSGSNQVQLAVLHSKLVSVFTLLSKDGAVEHGLNNNTTSA